MSARGFSLLELLVAMALTVTIAGAVLSAVVPVRSLVQRWHDGHDLEAGARSALDLIAANVREAGSNAAVTALDSPLARHLPHVMLTESLASALPASPAGAISIIRVPRVAAQGLTSVAAAAGASVVSLDTAKSCALAAPACGFQSGIAAVLISGSAAETTVIDSAGVGWVQLRAPLSVPFAAGTVVSEVTTVTYGLRSTGPGVGRLVQKTGGGAEQPLLDNVVRFEIGADHADLRLARRVTILLTVQSTGATDRLEAELRQDVALRNPGGGP